MRGPCWCWWHCEGPAGAGGILPVWRAGKQATSTLPPCSLYHTLPPCSLYHTLPEAHHITPSHPARSTSHHTLPEAHHTTPCQKHITPHPARSTSHHTCQKHITPHPASITPCQKHITSHPARSTSHHTTAHHSPTRPPIHASAQHGPQSMHQPNTAPHPSISLTRPPIHASAQHGPPFIHASANHLAVKGVKQRVEASCDVPEGEWGGGQVGI